MGWNNEGIKDPITQRMVLGSASNGVPCAGWAGSWEGAGRQPLRPGIKSLPLVFSLLGPNHKGHPRTSYYQYGLGILALCVHQKRLHDTVVGKLLYAVEHDHHLHRDHLSVGEWARPY